MSLGLNYCPQEMKKNAIAAFVPLKKQEEIKRRAAELNITVAQYLRILIDADLKEKLVRVEVGK